MSASLTFVAEHESEINVIQTNGARSQRLWSPLYLWTRQSMKSACMLDLEIDSVREHISSDQDETRNDANKRPMYIDLDILSS